MKLRTLFVAAAMAGAFIYFTSSGRMARFAGAGAQTPRVVRTAGLSSDELNNIQIYKAAHDATVHISSTVLRRDFFFDIIPSRETGSGFLVRDDGLILTNNHVVSSSQKLEVTLPDKSRYPATIVVRDAGNDLALIKITPRGKAPSLPLGDSEILQVGQKVLAIGNPFGLEGTLTTGIISSLNRDLRDETGRTLEGMIQTDAAINPGNSGGPLLDSQGNVIAVNTAIYGPGGNIGIGFAMPINRAKQLMEAYTSGRKWEPPRLGVSGVYLAGEWATALELPAEGGFLVDEVASGSAAEAAGIRGARRSVVIGNREIGIGGDLIMAIDGQRVQRGDSIARLIARKRPGDKVELTVWRNGRQSTLTVKLGAAQGQQL